MEEQNKTEEESKECAEPCCACSPECKPKPKKTEFKCGCGGDC